MTWHYNLNGATLGPVSREDILALYGKGTVNEATLVWDSAEGGEWRKYGDVQSFRSNTVPPPLPAAAVSDKWIWAMVSIPVVGAILELVISESFGLDTGGVGFIICYVAMYGVFASQDADVIKASGRKGEVGTIWGWVLFVPAYFFVRAKRLGKNQITLGAWIVSFVMGIFITEGPLSSQIYLGAGIPPCGSQASVAQVKTLFPQLPLNFVNLEAVDVTNIKTSSATSKKNSCSANVLATDGQEYSVVYTIEERGDQFYYLLNLN